MAVAYRGFGVHTCVEVRTWLQALAREIGAPPPQAVGDYLDARLQEAAMGRLGTGALQQWLWDATSGTRRPDHAPTAIHVGGGDIQDDSAPTLPPPRMDACLVDLQEGLAGMARVASGPIAWDVVVSACVWGVGDAHAALFRPIMARYGVVPEWVDWCARLAPLGTGTVAEMRQWARRHAVHLLPAATRTGGVLATDLMHLGLGRQLPAYILQGILRAYDPALALLQALARVCNHFRSWHHQPRSSA